MAILDIDNPQAPVSLDFEMHGKALEQRLPLPTTISGLGGVQSLLERPYLALQNRHRMTRYDREHFFLVVHELRKGSLLAQLGMVFTAFQPGFPLLSSLGPSGVWEYAKASFELLKLVFEATRRGQEVKYEWNSDRSIVNVNTGTQTNVFNGPVLLVAQQSLPTYQTLTEDLLEDGVDKFHLGVRGRHEISLGPNERGLFQLPSRVEKEPIVIKCEIFDFNKFDNVGKLVVKNDAQPVGKGDYRFSVIGEQDVKAFIEAMLFREVRITCLREILENPTTSLRTTRLQVISVEKL